MTPKYEGLGRKLTIESRNEKLGRYFLRQLSEEENDRLEEAIAGDPGSFEEARVIESELVDDYLRSNLSTSDQDAFRVSYLQSERRQERVAAAESMWRVANEQEVAVLAAQRVSTIRRLFGRWQIIAGFAAIFLVCGLIYVALTSGRLSVQVGRGGPGPLISTGVTEERYPDKNAVASATVDSANDAVVNGNAGVKRNPDRPASTGTFSSGIATFTLLPGALRDAGEQSIKIMPKTRTIDLRLSPPPAAAKYRAYSVVVKTADGDTAFEASSLKSLRFAIPAAKLENRTYVVFLEGLSEQKLPESVAEYTFRVRR